MRSRTLCLIIGAVAVLTTACGRLTNEGPGGPDTSIAHPMGADELVLRVDLGGGLLPIEYRLSELPLVSIYGDGRMIVQGPQIEIYPGPALPNLQVTQLSEQTIQAILAAARDAGLIGADASYGYDCVADAGTTTFTVVAEGRTTVVSAYALGFEADGMDCPGLDRDARDKLSAFQLRLGELTEGSAGSEEPYEPTAMRVYVLPHPGQQAELPQEPVRWPLTALDAFGEPLEFYEDVRCGVLDAGDLADLLPLANAANQLTPWTSAGSEYQLVFRPLLPDEAGC